MNFYDINCIVYVRSLFSIVREFNTNYSEIKNNTNMLIYIENQFDYLLNFIIVGNGGLQNNLH